MQNLIIDILQREGFRMDSMDELFIGSPMAAFLQATKDIERSAVERIGEVLAPAKEGEELLGPMTELERRMYCVCEQRIAEEQKAWQFFNDGSGMECGVCRGCEFLNAASPCAALRVSKCETTLRQQELILTIRRRLPAANQCVVRRGFVLHKRKPQEPYDVSQETILWSGGFPF